MCPKGLDPQAVPFLRVVPKSCGVLLLVDSIWTVVGAQDTVSRLVVGSVCQGHLPYRVPCWSKGCDTFYNSKRTWSLVRQHEIGPQTQIFQLCNMSHSWKIQLYVPRSGEKVLRHGVTKTNSDITWGPWVFKCFGFCV